MGLLCFSGNWHNPVQWSHYAESHRGICLAFDVESSDEMRKVRYVEKRIPPNLRAMKVMGEVAIEHMLDLLTIKFQHWQYEQEHRLFVRLNDKEESGLYFFDFGGSEEMKLREVIVGAQSQVSPQQVAEALGNIEHGVVSRKARLAFRTFEVVTQRSQDLWRPSRRRIGLRDPSFESLVDHALRQEDFSIPHDLIEPTDDKPFIRRKKDRVRPKQGSGIRSRSIGGRSKAKNTVKKGDRGHPKPSRDPKRDGNRARN
jgi:hypothetical protein